jgi:hypothetical protein
VLNVAGVIVSLVSIVYTAAVAASNFVAHLAREAVDIGGQLLARAAATLVSIGEALAAATAKLLEFLVQLATYALDAVLSPVVSAAASVDRATAAAGNASISDIGSLGYVTTAHAMAWAWSLDPLALAGVAFGTVLAVVLTGVYKIAPP